MAEGSPTVRRRELGTLLRELRKKKDLTVDQVAAHLECSASKISRIETGQRGAIPRDVRDLCDLYGVIEPVERDRLVSLAREGKQQGWWQSYDLPYSTYVGLEAEAIIIKDYEPAVVPGLLQSPDYVRGLYRDPMPEPSVGELTSDIIDKRIDERLRRQELLSRRDSPPLKFWAVLDEAVIRRPIGNPAVMVAQLKHILKQMQRPNVTVQVSPYIVGAHPALNSTFNILQFSNAAPDVVYIEGLAGRIFIDRPEDVERYTDVFKHLCDIALTPDHSKNFLEQAIEDYEKALARTLA